MRAKSRACYQSMPRQLAKESTKFQCGVVERRGTARKFGTAADWLEEANLVRNSAFMPKMLSSAANAIMLVK